MNLIVAVTSDWGIGCENDLIFKVPEDQKYFRSTTLGKVIVMGHGTLKSLPNSEPLKKRTNIILSRDTSLKIEGATVCNSVSHLLDALSEYKVDDVFIIGGGAVYAALLPYCTTAYITKFDATPIADTYFPNIDDMPGWALAYESELKDFNGLKFKFCTYNKE